MKPPASVCTKGEAHSDLSCNSCHTAWAPSCIGCHNAYDANEPGYDMLHNDFITGSWVEYVGEYQAHAPALGYREKDTKKTVIPVVPGMILTIDKQSYDPALNDTLLFHRLYAPSTPHTTQTKGRSCQSCHNNPVALGYGQGELTYTIHEHGGTWSFNAKYKNSTYDGLPEDAWTGFLQERSGKVSTRSDVRPFTLEEQKNISTVGACLTCHNENSEIMKESLVDYQRVLNNRNEQCILPFKK
jgi:cytochrome c553